jgi:hypothetical protein
VIGPLLALEQERRKEDAPPTHPPTHPSTQITTPCAQVIEVVCCRMTPLQQELYCHFLQSKVCVCVWWWWWWGGVVF